MTSLIVDPVGAMKSHAVAEVMTTTSTIPLNGVDGQVGAACTSERWKPTASTTNAKAANTATRGWRLANTWVNAGMGQTVNDGKILPKQLVALTFRRRGVRSSHYGAPVIRRRLTVSDLARLKGRRQLTMLRIFTIEEAAAAEEAGIDLASAPPELVSDPRYREVAPSLFTLTGRSHLEAGSADDHLRWAGEMLQLGADCIYCSGSMDRVEHLAKEYIPVVGHVGLVPSRAGWTGGFKAVGKTADEALRVYDECVALENAGAIAAEIEVVPPEVATEISRRMKRLSLWSMGSGAGCDAQYLFAMDILGDPTNQQLSGVAHVPRHSKVYRDFAAEHARLQRERVAAFTEYRLDVESGNFPADEHLVHMKPDEWQRFRSVLPDD